MSKIYFKKNKEFDDIEELLEYGYKGYNSSFKPTYIKTEKTTFQECHPARRSFGDLLIICRTYFPETTEKQLAKTIFKLNKKIGLRASYCSTINKVVFLKDRKNSPIDRHMTPSQKVKKGYGTHTFNEIVNLAK